MQSQAPLSSPSSWWQDVQNGTELRQVQTGAQEKVPYCEGSNPRTAPSTVVGALCLAVCGAKAAPGKLTCRVLLPPPSCPLLLLRVPRALFH